MAVESADQQRPRPRLNATARYGSPAVPRRGYRTHFDAHRTRRQSAAFGRSTAVDWRQSLCSQQRETCQGAIGMIYAKEFFDLQLQFARRVSELGAMPLQVALLDYTNLYVRFVGDRQFDGDDPIWSTYLAGFRGEVDLGDWTYRFYLHRPHRVQPPSVIATFGCFAYAMGKPGQIRLHFHNTDGHRHGPLSAERSASRLSELTSLVHHVRSQQVAVKEVAGVSWLYNLTAYRRLFPESYAASATVAENRFRNMPLWGQFLNRHGGIRKDAVTAFARRVSDRTTMDELAQCFPLQPLAVSAPIEAFFEFYAQNPAARFGG
ncbi:hypothetical protein OKW45_007223 [Paraburkholderia sp. WSM4175]